MRIFVAVGAALALVLTAAPARAQSASWADRPHDVAGLPYLDLTSVSVKNTKKAITVTYRSRSLGNRNGTEVVLLDTDPRKPGPELQVGFGRYSEGWHAPMRRWKVDRSKAARKKWNPSPYGKARPCDGTVRINSRWKRNFTPVTITVREKKGCITSKRVRVQVSTATDGFSNHQRSDTFGAVVRDQLPHGKRAFTPWVKQRSTKAKARRTVDGADSLRWWSDIRSVAVDLTNERLSVAVNHLARPVQRHGIFLVYLDTNGDPTPDYVIELGTNHPIVRQASGWTTGGRQIACSIDGELAGAGLTRTRFSMPSAPCLGNPESVRVAVVATDRTSPVYAPVDWWGGTRTWTPAVARG
ncbi:hypothetical protein AFL01nite_27020 [Aeromicrobium flavum]|uniref:Lipoprotein n=1 Tax=Aeromicrobium flavum TaxID=416568 RepID=A0A512HY54_9ACTN|nr:hypothetical protein [Aeromicrobium flavum]GEO90375.1 hypothetical protein AFL01nite_27020 [Aeromicrobium flavum]